MTRPRRIDVSAATDAARRRARAQGLAAAPGAWEYYAQDWPARKREFIENECFIASAFEGGGLRPLRLNRAQAAIYEAETAARAAGETLVVLKCRRLGVSTYFVASLLADCLFESYRHAVVVAHDPDTLRELMDAVRRLYANLRYSVRPAAKYDSKYELVIDDAERGVRDSRIRLAGVTPGREDKGRGLTVTHLHLTEVPYWLGDQRRFLTAMLDAARGGRVTYESTAGGTGDEFHRAYLAGKRPGSGFRSLFFPWWWHPHYRRAGYRIVAVDAEGEPRAALAPGAPPDALISDYDEATRAAQELPLASERDIAERIRETLVAWGELPPDADWRADAVAERLAWRRREIERLGGRVFRVEYPEDDVSAFSDPGGGVFDPTYTVVRCAPREPEEGRRYVVAVDPALGMPGRDRAAITVVDVWSGEQVYEWASDAERQDAQAARAGRLSDAYNGADIVVERNMGEAVILELERLGYGTRLYRYVDAAAQRDVEEGRLDASEALERARPGLPMTDRIKRLAVTALEAAWRSGEFRACSEELCAEARVFVQDGARLGAKSGQHDDRVMAAAIAWYWILTQARATPYVGVAPAI